MDFYFFLTFFAIGVALIAMGKIYPVFPFAGGIILVFLGLSFLLNGTEITITERFYDNGTMVNVTTNIVESAKPFDKIIAPFNIIFGGSAMLLSAVGKKSRFEDRSKWAFKKY
jgi:small neutral amino acid transporter SnatA (MarC family)